jgi:hypothetical protein
LKVEQILNQVITCKREVDFYVPVMVEFKDNDDKGKELFYYRMFNSKSSFVEMSINSVTKKIVNITLVSVNDVDVNLQKVSDLNISQEFGNPVIDVEIFNKEHIVTDNMNFSIIRNDKKVYVIQDSVDVKSRLSMGSAELLLDHHNNIVGIIFEGFSDVEWDEINESIDASVNIVLE